MYRRIFAMTRARSDADRRRTVQILQLQSEVDRLAYERDQLRLELHPIVLTRGWRDPQAVEMVERFGRIETKWKRAFEQLRKIRTEARQ